MIRQVEYFEKPGKENISRCLEIYQRFYRISAKIHESLFHED